MKPETTWKEEVRKWFTSEMWFGMEPYGDLSEDLTDFPDTLEFIESLLSSSQALAREELLHENELATTWLGDVKKSLQKEKTRLRGEGVDLRLKPIWQSIHAGIFSAQERRKFIKTNSDSALQEKLDTKGV